jgi:hypothetical protein
VDVVRRNLASPDYSTFFSRLTLAKADKACFSITRKQAYAAWERRPNETMAKPTEWL